MARKSAMMIFLFTITSRFRGKFRVNPWDATCWLMMSIKEITYSLYSFQIVVRLPNSKPCSEEASGWFGVPPPVGVLLRKLKVFVQ